MAVRVRPISNKELNAKDECCLKTEENRVWITMNIDNFAIKWKNLYFWSRIQLGF